MKDLQINDKISIGDRTFVVTARDDETFNAPDYTLKNIETGEIHEPVQWIWLVDREEVKKL